MVDRCSSSESIFQFFDPIRAFFVRAKLDHAFDIEQYSVTKWLRSKILPENFSFRETLHIGDSTEDGLPKEEDEVVHGRNALRDRVEAEKALDGWLKEMPGELA